MTLLPACSSFLRCRTTHVRALLLLAPLAGVPLQGAAQTVENPRFVEFTASANHNDSQVDGQPVVLRYDLEVYVVGASAPFHTVDIGKPTPQTNGLIRYDFSTDVGAWPLPGGTYEARVVAVGSELSGRSSASNPFQFATAGLCNFVLSKSSIDFTWPGERETISVTVPSGCGWVVTTSAPWLTIGTPGGFGSGTAVFTAMPNETREPRSATLMIGPVPVTVLQTERPSSYPLAPQSFRVIAPVR
jgi:hypothetical protein